MAPEAERACIDFYLSPGQAEGCHQEENSSCVERPFRNGESFAESRKISRAESQCPAFAAVVWPSSCGEVGRHAVMATPAMAKKRYLHRRAHAAMSEPCGIMIVTLLRRNHQHLKSRVGVSAADALRRHSFCIFLAYMLKCFKHLYAPHQYRLGCLPIAAWRRHCGAAPVSRPGSGQSRLAE